MGLSKVWEIVKDRKTDILKSMGSQRVRHNQVTEEQRINKIRKAYTFSLGCILFIYKMKSFKKLPLGICPGLK